MTTVIVQPRDATGAVDYESALLVQDSRNLANALRSLWLAHEQVDCGQQTAAKAEAFLAKLGPEAVLRVGTHLMRESAKKPDLSSQVAQLIRALRCPCDADPVTGDPSKLMRVAVLLSTADDPALYALHATALKIATACRGPYEWSLHAPIDTAVDLARRARLRTVALLIRSHRGSTVINVNTALRTLNLGFERMLTGAVPTLPKSPTMWQLIWMGFSSASAHLSESFATPFMRLLAADYEMAKEAYAKGQQTLAARQ
jgi:hypothetical protein